MNNNRRDFIRKVPRCISAFNWRNRLPQWLHKILPKEKVSIMAKDAGMQMSEAYFGG